MRSFRKGIRGEGRLGRRVNEGPGAYTTILGKDLRGELSGVGSVYSDVIELKFSDVIFEDVAVGGYYFSSPDWSRGDLRGTVEIYVNLEDIRDQYCIDLLQRLGSPGYEKHLCVGSFRIKDPEFTVPYNGLPAGPIEVEVGLMEVSLDCPDPEDRSGYCSIHFDAYDAEMLLDFGPDLKYMYDDAQEYWLDSGES